MPGNIPAESSLVQRGSGTESEAKQAFHRKIDLQVGGGPLVTLPTREGLQHGPRATDGCGKKTGL